MLRKCYQKCGQNTTKKWNKNLTNYYKISNKTARKWYKNATEMCPNLHRTVIMIRCQIFPLCLRFIFWKYTWSSVCVRASLSTGAWSAPICIIISVKINSETVSMWCPVFTPQSLVIPSKIVTIWIKWWLDEKFDIWFLGCPPEFLDLIKNSIYFARLFLDMF